METIDERIKALPPDLQQVVEDLIVSLSEKWITKPKGIPRFDWEGALADLGEQCSSVELQHKISNWMAGEE